MRLAYLALIAVTSFWAAGPTTASADYNFTFANVVLTDGGTITGSFSTNNALTQLTAADITTVKGGNSNFPGYHYTLANSTDTSTLPNYFHLTATGTSSLYDLFLNFSLTPLSTTTPVVLNGESYEDERGRARGVLSGSVVLAPNAVPEPSSLLLCGLAGGVALAARRARGGRLVG